MSLGPKEISSFNELIDRYDNFIFDCDGVLWDAGEKLGKAFETLNILKQKGKSLFFLSNNSTRSRKTYAKKIFDFGYETDTQYIYPSSYVAPAYIKLHDPEVKKVYVIGMKGFVEEVNEAGFQVVGGPEDNDKKFTSEREFMKMPFEKDIDAILVGNDMDFNYYKLAYASACLQKGAKFFASNDDAYDMAGNMKLPTTGTMVAAISKGTGREPQILGKPNKYCIEIIAEHHKLNKEKCLIIGDRIDTDILTGKNAGVDTCLVLTGVYNREMLELHLKMNDPIIPNYICPAVCIT